MSAFLLLCVVFLGMTSQPDIPSATDLFIAQATVPPQPPIPGLNIPPEQPPGSPGSPDKPAEPQMQPDDRMIQAPPLRPQDIAARKRRPIVPPVAQPVVPPVAPPVAPAIVPLGASGKTPVAPKAPVSGIDDKGAGVPKEAEKKCKPMPPTARVQMNFPEAEIIDIVRWISEQTCKNFIISDSIRGGKLTILSATPVTADEAYRAFLSALNVNNMTVIKVGRFYKIQMKRDSIKDTIPTYTGTEVTIPMLDQMVTRLVQLKYSDANTVSGTMKQLTTKDGDCYPYTPTNLLIISDTASNIVRLMQIINQLDTPQGQEEIRVIQVKFAMVNELSPKLLEIFGDKSKTGVPGGQQAPRIQPVRPPGVPPGTPGEGEAGEETVRVSKIIPDERTNKLIVVASSRSFPQIRQVIDQLDVPIAGGDQIQVIYLENANAEEMASTLTALSQGSATRTKAPMPPPGAAGVPGVKAAELFQGEVKVTSDKSTNSLVVVANKHDFKSLIQVVKKLDIPRRQVFVEAVLMEVNIDTARDLGFAFHGGTAAKIGDSTIPLFFGTQFKAQGSNFNSLSMTSALNLLGFISGLRGPDLSSSESVLGSAGITLPSFGVMLEALQTDSNVNVISTPHILTSDNEEAEIKVGDNIPIPAGYSPYSSNLSSLAGLSSLGKSSTTSGISSLLGGTTGMSGYNAYSGLLGGMASINRQDVGLTLKIKPQINKGDYIRMELEEELSDVKDASGVYGPTTTKRSAKTVVVVQDQQTVVVGGLMRDKVGVTESKIPLLGDIPVIGFFFRNKNVQKTKTNLLLFLTPYVIESQADFKAIFERKIHERKEFLEKFYNAGKEYQSFVDFRRKHGPLADMHLNLRQELQRTENGGPGIGAEVLITPPAESEKAPGEDKPAAEAKPAPDDQSSQENKSAPVSKPTPDDKAAPPTVPPTPGENTVVIPAPVAPEEAAPVTPEEPAPGAPDDKGEPSPAERLEVE
jgi:general secretion pathway protein D